MSTSKKKINIDEYLEEFSLITHGENMLFKTEDSQATLVDTIKIKNRKIKRYTNEFWTSKQRQHSSIHEISYRACFKPQLPRFFIDIFTKKGAVIYDPFGGRGTTALEAGLLSRNVVINDINPLTEILTKPRFFIPDLKSIEDRLNIINIDNNLKADIDLSMFYHTKTEAEIVSLKNYLKEKKDTNTEDYIDKWIRMIATNRLTGHSTGFFSVYTLPPNQAVSQNSQLKINQKRNQIPEYRDTRKRILKKSQSLLRNLTKEQITNLNRIGEKALFTTCDVRNTNTIEFNSINLLVTSPPFLDIVQYSSDNWLRCWFNSIDDKNISKNITVLKNINDWSEFIGEAFKEFHRIISYKGIVAFEVGEVRKGTIMLDEYVVPLGIAAGFKCLGILINMQEFTKTSNIWGIRNNNRGTNTNRIVIFQKNK